MNKNKLLHILGSVCRTLLAITFIFSGFVKAIDPLGTTYKVEDYLKAFGGVFGNFVPLAEPMAWSLIAFEFVLGVCLLCNIKTQWTSWFALLIMLVMTPLTLYIAIANPVSDCGCFGDALVISNWATFWKNVVLLALVLILLLTKHHIPQLLCWQAEVGVFCVAIGFVLCFMLYARMHLPVADFRPYKIGNNLIELMEYPEDAEPDLYEIQFIYEKDGKQQTFTLDNYPKGDSTWTFVDQHSKLIRKGYEPPVHDFEIITLDGEDLTDDILSEQQIMLIVMYDLRKTDLSQIGKVSTLLKQAEEDGCPCYILTGSGEDDIIDFILQIESEIQYPLSTQHFCQTDPVTLKTIVRANPGVIILNEGIVIDKYNLRTR